MLGPYYRRQVNVKSQEFQKMFPWKILPHICQSVGPTSVHVSTKKVMQLLKLFDFPSTEIEEIQSFLYNELTKAAPSICETGAWWEWKCNLEAEF